MEFLMAWFVENGDNLKTLMSIISPFIAIYGTNMYAENRTIKDNEAKAVAEASTSKDVKIETLEGKVEAAKSDKILVAIEALSSDLKALSSDLKALDTKVTNGFSNQDKKHDKVVNKINELIVACNKNFKTQIKQIPQVTK